MNSLLKGTVAAACLLATLGGVAHAGGFSRGSADTDILFEDGNFNMRSSVTYVTPTRKYKTNALNPELIGVNYADDYAIPSFALKLKISDSLSCAGTYTESFGGSATWPTPSGTLNKLDEDFTIYEAAATCGLKFDLSKGRLWVIGGVYHEDVNYNLNAVAGQLNVNLKDQNFGWRAGLAYEIPEIALRTQIMYRSGVDIKASGSAVAGPYFTGGAPATVGASGETQFPQSVEFKAQTGVAPGWLVYGSVKWTDWSVTKTLNLYVPDLGITNGNQYYWRDGWTVTGGVGHQFNDWLSGTVFATWDRGVSTGWDMTAETYTVGTGVSMKDKLGGELRLAAAVSRLGSSEETQYGSALERSVGKDWAYILSGGYSIKW
jgi:long-chain fatty acid transport protein